MLSRIGAFFCCWVMCFLTYFSFIIMISIWVMDTQLRSPIFSKSECQHFRMLTMSENSSLLKTCYVNVLSRGVSYDTITEGFQMAFFMIFTRKGLGKYAKLFWFCALSSYSLFLFIHCQCHFCKALYMN